MKHETHYQSHMTLVSTIVNIYEYILDNKLKNEINIYLKQKYTLRVVEICKNKNICEDKENIICSYL
jgi:hypothetical protein